MKLKLLLSNVDFVNSSAEGQGILMERHQSLCGVNIPEAQIMFLPRHMLKWYARSSI